MICQTRRRELRLLTAPPNGGSANGENERKSIALAALAVPSADPVARIARTAVARFDTLSRSSADRI